MHQYTITNDEPLFRQAKANADLLSGVRTVGHSDTALSHVSLHILYNILLHVKNSYSKRHIRKKCKFSDRSVYIHFLQKVYKSSWEKQREKGFELRLDSLAILSAKAKRDLASDVSSFNKTCASNFSLHIWGLINDSDTRTTSLAGQIQGALREKQRQGYRH